MLTKFYKGRMGIIEALEQPIGLIHTLYYIAVKESATDEGKNRLQSEAAEEALGV